MREQRLSGQVFLFLCCVFPFIVPAESSANARVVLQLRWDHQFQFAGYYAAQWEGYYEEEGIDVHIRSALSADGTILRPPMEVSEGRAHFGVDGADILIAADRGVPLTVLASIFQQSAAEIYGFEGVGLSKPDDLITKRVALVPKSLVEWELKSMLASEGIDPARLNSVELKPPGLEQLINGEADLVAGYRINFPYLAQQSGHTLVSLRPSTYGVDFYGDSLFTTRKMIETRPDLAEGFLRATLKGWKYALARPWEVAERISAEYKPTYPVPDYRAFNLYQITPVRELAGYPMTHVGHVNPERWRSMHSHLKRLGVVTGDLDIASFIYDPERQREIRARNLKYVSAGVGGFLMFSTALSLLWIAGLRRTVASRTNEITLAKSRLEEELELRKESEELIRHSESKYRNIFENALVGMFRTDAEFGRLIEVNQRCAEIYGFSRPEEMVGRLTSEFFVEQGDKEEIRSIVESDEGIVHRISRMRRVDGKEIVVEGTAWPGSEPGTIEGIHVDITDQIRSQEALRESKELFQSLVETTSDWIWEVDENCRYVYASPKIRDLLGYAPEEVIGKSPFEYMPPDEGERVKAAFEKIRGSCVPFTNLQNRNVCKDGSEIILESSGVPVPKAGGALCGYRGVDRDVTERRRMEDDLWESRERLQLAKTAAGIGIHDFNISTGTIQWDRLVRDLWGIGPEEPVTYETFIAGVHPEDRAATQAAVDRALRPTGDRRYHAAYRVVSRADGAMHWVEATGQVFFEQGRAVRLIGTLQDISDRVRTEQALRESEEKFRAVFEGAVESIYIHDLQGRFLDANTKGYERLGYTKEELLRMTPQDIDDNREMVQEWIETILKEGSLSFESVHIRKDGSRFPVEINSQVIQYGGGRAILGVVRDITERKVNEKALRDLANELEDKVNERTSELVRANRAKDEFLANMSHEIRTPLAGVFGITDVLLQQDRCGSVRGDLEIIRSSAGTVLSLLNDLLDLSRIERGKLELSPKRFCIRGMLQQCIQPYERQTADLGLGFTFFVAPEVPDSLLGDPERLDQVLKNLLSNALKFTEHGSIGLTVELVEETERLARLRFSVSDTGIGIPLEKQDRLFRSFTQIDPTYSKKFAGAGLGLAISKRIVELMSGEISVGSEAGKGATFSFTVSFDKVEPEDLREQAPLRLEDVPPLSILLAEDNPVNRLFLKRALVSAGHSVDEATNGRDALHKLEGKRFDLILMDIQMPEMDGLEATRRIRSGGHGATGIPIIALTAYAMKGDREKFIAQGVDGYVTKPVDFNALSQTIMEVVRGATDSSDPAM
jgi:two-component system, sensor histidine kinase and response regulator